MDALTAFIAQSQLVETTVRGIREEDWALPGLGEWTVAELVAHLIRAADRISAYLDVPVEGPAVRDRVSYLDFGSDPQAVAELSAAVADRSRQDAASIGIGGLVDSFAGAWRRTVERVADLPDDRVIHTIQGPMALAEYAATRVLELVVHHMDLCRALDIPEVTDPDALQMTAAILLGLLDGPPPEGLTDAAFIMAATGRDRHDDPRLPVLV